MVVDDPFLRPEVLAEPCRPLAREGRPCDPWHDGGSR